jgi:hypothetical protein
MIRVFARKTSMTPTDDLAFFDEPPLFELPDQPVMVSVTFTWDIQRGLRLLEAWRRLWAKRGSKCRVRIGGPAFDVSGGKFTPGMFLREGVTITSRGCPKQCPWCLVPVREGRLSRLYIHPGNIIQDNNLLACPRGHIEQVFDMLITQTSVQFKGGLDIDYLESWHVDCLKLLWPKELWVSCDNEAGLKRLDKARDLLSDFSIEQRRCYVLIGFDGDTPDAAQRRLEAVYDQERGFLPQAMFHQPTTTAKRQVPLEWFSLNRKWSRLASIRPRKSPAVDEPMLINEQSKIDNRK